MKKEGGLDVVAVFGAASFWLLTWWFLVFFSDGAGGCFGVVACEPEGIIERGFC